MKLARPSSCGLRACRPWWPGLLLCGLYLLLLGLVPLEARPFSRHDDDLFVSLAHHVANGQWLGPYGELTLVKGPLLAMVLGVAMAIRLPAGLLLRGLYALCCWLACQWAIPPKPRGLRWLGLGLLLADPWMLTLPGSRYSREALYAGLLLLGLALAVAALQRHQPALLAAASLVLGLLLICREARLALLPVELGLLMAWLGGRSWRPKRSWLAAALALLLFVLPLLSLQQVNRHIYGVGLSSELEEGSFPKLYSALVSVNVPGLPAKPYVPLRQEVIHHLIQLSPESQLAAVLRQLDPHWTHFGCRQQASMCQEYGGGWLLWALREAMHRAHPQADALSFQQQGKQLHAELQRLCGQKESRTVLDCRRRSIGFLPWLPGREERLPIAAAAWDFGHKTLALLLPPLVKLQGHPLGAVQLQPLPASSLQRWPAPWQQLGIQPRSVPQTKEWNRRLAAVFALGLWARLATAGVVVILLMRRGWAGIKRPSVADGLLLLTLALQLALLTAVELTSFRADRYLILLSPSLTLLIMRLWANLLPSTPDQAHV